MEAANCVCDGLGGLFADVVRPAAFGVAGRFAIFADSRGYIAWLCDSRHLFGGREVPKLWRQSRVVRYVSKERWWLAFMVAGRDHMSKMWIFCQGEWC